MNKKDKLLMLQKTAAFALKKGKIDTVKQVRALMLKLILNKEG